MLVEWTPVKREKKWMLPLKTKLIPGPVSNEEKTNKLMGPSKKYVYN